MNMISPSRHYDPYSEFQASEDFDKLSLSDTLSSSSQDTVPGKPESLSHASTTLGAHSIQPHPDRDTVQKLIVSLGESLSHCPQDTKKELCEFLVRTINETTGQTPKLKLISDKACVIKLNTRTPAMEKLWHHQFQIIKNNQKIKDFNQLVPQKKLKKEPNTILQSLKDKFDIPDDVINKIRTCYKNQGNNKLIRLINVVEQSKTISPFAIMTVVFHAGHKQVISERDLQALPKYPEDDARNTQQNLSFHPASPAPHSWTTAIAYHSPFSLSQPGNTACTISADDNYGNLQDIPPYRVINADDQPLQDDRNRKVLNWLTNIEDPSYQIQQIRPDQELVTASPGKTTTTNSNPKSRMLTRRAPPAIPKRRECLPEWSKKDYNHSEIRPQKHFSEPAKNSQNPVSNNVIITSFLSDHADIHDLPQKAYPQTTVSESAGIQYLNKMLAQIEADLVDLDEILKDLNQKETYI